MGPRLMGTLTDRATASWVPSLVLLLLRTSLAADRVPVGELEHIYVHYNERPGFNHWLEYGRRYEQLLPPRQASGDIRLLEIGVQSGGSTRVWRQYYGSRLYYVGVDINPKAQQFEVRAERTFVHVGSSSDEPFLTALCAEHGPFDVVVDDGGHTNALIRKALDILMPRSGCLRDGGVYVIEDTHSMAFQRPANNRTANRNTGSNNLANIASEAFAGLHRHFFERQMGAKWQSRLGLDRPLGTWATHVAEMHAYALAQPRRVTGALQAHFTFQHHHERHVHS